MNGIDKIALLQINPIKVITWTSLSHFITFTVPYEAHRLIESLILHICENICNSLSSDICIAVLSRHESSTKSPKKCAI